MYASFVEINSLSKDLDSTKIYGQIRARLIDWSNCGQLLLTMLLYLSYSVFNVFPIFPPSIREISFVGFELLDFPALAIFTGI